MIHLDTNFLIGMSRAGTVPAGRVAAWIVAGEKLGCSAIAWAEFLCGPLSAADQSAAAIVIGEPEAIIASDAVLAAELFNRSGRRRGSLADCLIAAVALRTRSALATENVADFDLFVGDGLAIAG